MASAISLAITHVSGDLSNMINISIPASFLRPLEAFWETAIMRSLENVSALTIGHIPPKKQSFLGISEGMGVWGRKDNRLL